MMMKKILSTCSWPKSFLHYTLFGRETSLLRRRTPHFLRENKLFIRDTWFYSFAIYFLGGRGMSVLWREASPPKSRWSPGFQVMDFESGSTE